jgi:hypothetical protein
LSVNCAGAFDMHIGALTTGFMPAAPPEPPLPAALLPATADPPAPALAPAPAVDRLPP